MTPHDNNNHHHRPAVQPARVDNNRSATESQPPSTSNRPSVAMTAVHGKAIDWESINWESSGGRLFIDRPLAPHTWFQVGGKADIFFIADREPALKQFLQLLPATMPRLVIGAASNLLVRDGGFRGAVIKLGKDFQTANLQDGFIVAGAAMLVASLAQWAMTNAYKGFAFYCGIPGTVGGAVAMNAGCFGGETRDL
ncbi:MAG: FAD-binding protein, partial [Alphaproteobacteria bacterium]|nr:FAD-binding protein [Alphaproteobacteria bacterium]